MFSVYLLLFARWFVGLTFAWSSSAKLRSFAGFEAAVFDFGLLPTRWTRPVAAAVVAAEAAIALAMLTRGFVLSAGFLAAIALLVGLTTAIVTVLRRKARVACNCFGASDRVLTRYDVARNAAMVAVCTVGLACSHALTVPVEPLAAVGVVGAAAFLVALVANLGDVLETLRRPFTLDEEPA